MQYDGNPNENIEVRPAAKNLSEMKNSINQPEAIDDTEMIVMLNEPLSNISEECTIKNEEEKADNNSSYIFVIIGIIVIGTIIFVFYHSSKKMKKD